MTTDPQVIGRLRSLVSEHELAETAVARLGRLLDALEEPTAPTAVHDPRVAVDQHVADSLVALHVPEVRSATTIADLGAGAGPPGLVLSIARPDTEVVLVESVSRKCRFLERVTERLKLHRTSVVCTRIESWAAGRERCDVVCARALASLPVLCEYAAPLLVEGGVLVAWKGQVEPPEVAAGDAACARLGLAPLGVRAVHPFPGARHRTLHLYRKMAPTPPGFPRRPGIATKRPISANPSTQPDGSAPNPPPVPLASDAAMGTVYAIANQKGGVGKTTTAVNVAACIAEAGYETLLVDVDPQGNATTGLGVDRHGVRGLYDVLDGEVSLADAVRSTDVRRLSIVASTPDLAGATMELPRQPGSECRLRDALAPVRGRYAYTLLDCPPSLGPLTVNALVAADRVIVPVQTEYFALEGLAGLLDTLALIQRELNPRLTVAGMLLTMYDGRTKLAQDVEREVRQHFPALVFDTVIPRNVRLGEAPSFGRPVIHHDPHCSGADAYFELAKEVAARG